MPPVWKEGGGCRFHIQGSNNGGGDNCLLSGNSGGGKYDGMHTDLALSL